MAMAMATATATAIASKNRLGLLRRFLSSSSLANLHPWESNPSSHTLPQRPDSSSAGNPSRPIPLWASYRVRGQALQELRKDGMIPGMVSDYHIESGNQVNDFVALQRKEVWGHLTRMGRKAFMSAFYELQLREHPGSDKVERTIKVHPSKLYLINGRRSILNVAFVRVRRHVKLKMSIPLKFRGRTVCPGLIQGGTLVVLKKAVSCLVLPNEVPPYIEVDVSHLKVGDRILVNDLDLDLQYKRQAGLVVCEVKKYRSVRRNRSGAILDFEIPQLRG